MRTIRLDKKTGLYLPEGMRVKNKGYGEAGASWRRRALKGFDAQSGSPQEDIDFHNYTLRQRARMLYMAAPIATSAIRTNRTNVVGVGLRLKSRIDREVLGMTAAQAEAWQKATEREFSLWANNKQACDATGMNNFYGLQQLALMSWLLSGDCIGVIKQRKPTRLLPYAARIHLVEADRVATPTECGNYPSTYYTTGRNQQNGNLIYDGVEVDQDGMVVAYHIRNTHPFEVETVETIWTRVEARQEHTGLPNVLHVIDTERADQYRGVSYLAQVIEPLLQLRRYTESELMAAVVESFYTIFITTEADTDEMPYNETGQGPPGEPGDPNDYRMGPGQINMLKPGEDIKSAKPEHPNGSFDKFAEGVGTQIGAALEIPHGLLLKKFHASYSASRAELLSAWQAFRMRREWLSTTFCKPSYEVWMSEAVARGRIHAPGFFIDPLVREAYLGSEWIGPSQGQLDPVKEITAEVLACSEGFSTHEQSTIRLNGGQWDGNVEQLQRENEKLGRKAPDPHQDGGAGGSREGAQKEEEQEEGNSNPNSPKNALGRGHAALCSLVIAEQIKQSIQGGEADETTQ